MQKLWSSKSKRSQPLASEEKSMEVSVEPSEETEETSDNVENNTDDSRLHVNSINFYLHGFGKYIPVPIKNLSWENYSNWLLFLIGIGGILVVANWGIRYLTAPESTPTSTLVCKSKIDGDWETPFGKINLQEKGNDYVVGQYEYSNFERGKVQGKLTGKQANNKITFDWQENLTQPDQKQGKGVLIFGEGCTEFYGSYGIGDSNNNFGNWRGYRLLK